MSFCSDSDFESLSAEIESKRATEDEYEDLQSIRVKLLEHYPMTVDQVKEWYADACKEEKKTGDYSLVYEIFSAVKNDAPGFWFNELCLNHYLSILISSDSEEVNTFISEFFEAIYEDHQNSPVNFTNSHISFDIKLKFVWHMRRCTIKGLFDEDSHVESTPLESDIKYVQELFEQQLSIRHEHLDETFARFSSFVTSNCPGQYNDIMPKVNSIYQKTKKSQEQLEYVFTEQRTGTPEEISISFLKSLNSLKKEYKETSSVFYNALVDSNTPALWMQFVLISYEQKVINITDTLKLFIRHHPRYIPAYTEFFTSVPMDTSEFAAIAMELKQKGLLNEYESEHWPGLIVSMLGAQRTNWISREGLLELALKRNDNFHPVERFIASLYEREEEFEEARNVHRLLTTTFPTEAEGWLISYQFEKGRDDQHALRVLTAAINRAEQLDWPERIFEEAIRFSQLIESRTGYQTLRAKIEKKKLEVEEVRAQEAEAVDVSQFEELEITENRQKRKADDSDEDEEPLKRKENVRDREQLTIAVRNLPANVQERTLRNFFRNCGTIRDIRIITVGESSQANIEFTNEQEVLRAITKDYKRISGQEVRVQKLQQSTVFVTNFPPSFTQEQLQEIFESVGTISSIRFPSLKFNSQRRFAYVEFTDSSNAQAAVGLLDGKQTDGFTLSVQISDPSVKKNRSGATEEGRVLYITKLDFYKVDANKIKQLFDKYGVVENVHLPLSEQNKELKRKNDGYGFITFSTPEEAQAALSLNMTILEGRAVQVSISEKKSLRTQKQERKAFKDYMNCSNVIAVAHLPDTISSAQLKQFFGVVGQVDEVVLEPKNSGAIIAFSNENDAGTASLKLQGKLIGNYTVQITTVKDLRNSDAKTSVPTSTTTVTPMMVPSNLRRRRMMSTPIAKSVIKPIATSEPTKPEETQKTEKRTNADFRAMLLGKK